MSIQRVQEALNQLTPWACGRRLVVAMSGGPDSQCLSHALATMGQDLGIIKIVGCGIDHGLRPQAAEELELASNLAEALNVPFTVRRVIVPPDQNILSGAREARLRALEEVRIAEKCDAVALGHHADDQIETLLTQWPRGAHRFAATPMLGLEGTWLRPLLSLRKLDLEAYCVEAELPHALDPSNRDPARTRGALRTLPLSEALDATRETWAARMQPGFERLRQDDAYLTEIAGHWLRGRLGPLGALCLDDWNTLPPPIRWRVLGQWFDLHDLPRTETLFEVILGSEEATAQQWAVRQGLVRRESGHLWWIPPPTPWSREVNASEIRLPAGVLRQEQISGTNTRFRAFQADRVAFDRAALMFPLRVRTWRAGDRLRPFGLKGTATVSDMLTNLRIPHALRRVWPVVEDASGEILWLVGLRRGAAAAVTPSTQKTTVLRTVGFDLWRPTQSEETIGSE